MRVERSISHTGMAGIYSWFQLVTSDSHRCRPWEAPVTTPATGFLNGSDFSPNPALVIVGIWGVEPTDGSSSYLSKEQIS